MDFGPISHCNLKVHSAKAQTKTLDMLPVGSFSKIKRTPKIITKQSKTFFLESPYVGETYKTNPNEKIFFLRVEK